jgi:hypothetical protein
VVGGGYARQGDSQSIRARFGVGLITSARLACHLTNRLHGRYGLTLFERHASIKAALGEMLAEWPHIQAVVVGARRTDPYYGMSHGRGVCMSGKRKH